MWRPGEADVSIRPGWFWHKNEDEKVRTAENLVELYFSSVGRNAGLLLNVPPTAEGLFHPTDVARIADFAERLRATFATNLAAGAPRSANGDRATARWVQLDLARPATFDVACLEEAIEHGQCVARYSLQVWTGAAWTTLARGTTIGHKKLDRFPAVTASRVRLTIDAALDTPRIANVALYQTLAS